MQLITSDGVIIRDSGTNRNLLRGILCHSMPYPWQQGGAVISPSESTLVDAEENVKKGITA